MPIEQSAPELERIVSLDQETEELGTGFGGNLAAEGPVWWKEWGYVLFSDIGNSRRLKWAPGEGVTVFQESTNGGNGMTRDRQGRLVVCEDITRRVVRLEPDGSTTVLAYHYQGRRLNRPNDVVAKSDGSIFFTDPTSPTELGTGLDLDFSGVYRISPDIGNLTLVVRGFLGPNGLAFSPDESILYINDTRRRHIRAFRRTAQRGAFPGQRPGLLRPEWGPVWAPRRNEGGRGGECLLRRAWRDMGHGPLWEAPGDHSAWAAPHHQYGLG